jgi:hypothetical protein
VYNLNIITGGNNKMSYLGMSLTDLIKSKAKSTFKGMTLHKEESNTGLRGDLKWYANHFDGVCVGRGFNNGRIRNLIQQMQRELVLTGGYKAKCVVTGVRVLSPDLMSYVDVVLHVQSVFAHDGMRSRIVLFKDIEAYEASKLYVPKTQVVEFHKLSVK